jgi:hypothetical protein
MTKPLVPEDRRDLPYRGAVEFVSLARHLMLGRGDVMEARESAEADAGCPRRVIEVLKSAVSAGSLTDPTWAGNLAQYRAIVGAYVDALASVSFFDRAMADNAFVKVPPEATAIVIVSQSATGTTTSELAPIPVSSMQFTLPSVSLRKTSTDVVLSLEVVRDPRNAGIIGRHLQRRTAAAVDVTAIAEIISSGTSTATTGGTVANLISDLQSMFADIEIGDESKLYFIMNSALAVGLSARLAGNLGWQDFGPTGGTIAGVPVVISAGAPSGSLILVDASRFASFSETITLKASQQGMMQLNTAPDSPAVASTVMTSLWQQNLIALRAMRYWGIENLTSTCASTTTGMS